MGTCGKLPRMISRVIERVTLHKWFHIFLISAKRSASMRYLVPSLAILWQKRHTVSNFALFARGVGETLLAALHESVAAVKLLCGPLRNPAIKSKVAHSVGGAG